MAFRIFCRKPGWRGETYCLSTIFPQLRLAVPNENDPRQVWYKQYKEGYPTLFYLVNKASGKIAFVEPGDSFGLFELGDREHATRDGGAVFQERDNGLGFKVLMYYHSADSYTAYTYQRNHLNCLLDAKEQTLVENGVLYMTYISNDAVIRDSMQWRFVSVPDLVPVPTPTPVIVPAPNHVPTPTPVTIPAPTHVPNPTPVVTVPASTHVPNPTPVTVPAPNHVPTPTPVTIPAPTHVPNPTPVVTVPASTHVPNPTPVTVPAPTHVFTPTPIAVLAPTHVPNPTPVIATPPIPQYTQPSNMIYCLAGDGQYSVAVQDGKIVLTYPNANDPTQHWYKDDRQTTKGGSFMPVNKATFQAIKHSLDDDEMLKLVNIPITSDGSFLWTESEKDIYGFSFLVTANNFALAVDAQNRDHKGAYVGMHLLTSNNLKRDYQKWKFVPSGANA